MGRIEAGANKRNTWKNKYFQSYTYLKCYLTGIFIHEKLVKLHKNPLNNTNYIIRKKVANKGVNYQR